MQPASSHDVIVAGGGPAGLGAAYHLARRGISVLLLEKSKQPCTEKTWLTFDDTIERYGLQDAVRNRFAGIDFGCYLGSRFSFKRSDFLFPLDEEKALSLLAQSAQRAGARLHYGEPFIHYAQAGRDRAVTVTSAQGRYRCRIIIDAMGCASEMLYSRGLKNETIQMGCLAFFLHGIRNNNSNRLILYDSFLPGPDYFWLVPLEEGRLMAGLFCFAPLTSHNLARKTDKLSLYLQARGVGGTVYDTKMGNIPLGNQNAVSSGPFLCVGDSANTALPSSGFSFHRCLEEAERAAEAAEEYLQQGGASLSSYKRAVLSRKIPGIEVHLIISDMLSKFTDPMLNKAIGEMNNLDEDFLIAFLSGRDMSINFSVQALRAILATFTLSELSALSLKQNHFKNLANLYNLLPSVGSAKLVEQLIDCVTAMTKKYRQGKIP